ncbi:MAG: DegT/DnrJ/EryC1/StrS family aminotransferase [Phycisphaerae bacterium]
MARDAVRQFEAAFAEYQGAAAARAFWMGRVGLCAVLRALGVAEGDRVGLCAYTCLGTVEGVCRLRARPVFLDVDRHMNIAPAALERPNTPLKALVLQHTFGVPSDIDAALSRAHKDNIPVIEDCCHALGATWKERLVGTFGVAAIFSFQWGKSFSTGQGGMLTFQDASLARELDRLAATDAVVPTWREAGSLAVQRQLFRWFVTPRTRPWLRKVYGWACNRGLISGSEPTSEQLLGPAKGFFKLCSPGQARAGLRQLRLWPETMQRRCETAAEIHRELDRAGVAFERPDSCASPVYLRCPVWVRSKQAALETSAAQNLDVAGWYCTPAHPLEGRALEELGYQPGSCPTAEAAFARVVTLPTWPALKPAQLGAAVRIIQNAV